MKGITFETNPNKRCVYCKGREVQTYMDGDLIEINLDGPYDGIYKCKDINECRQNIEAENTQIVVSENGYKVVKDFDKTIIEVEYTDEYFNNEELQ